MKRFTSLLFALLLFAWTTVPALVVHASTPNLMANPSAETLSGGNPANWTADSWGTSTTTLSLSSDAHSGSEALSINTTSRTSGDAKWMPDPVAVTSGQSYTYTDYSKASVATELDAAYTDANGVVSYTYLGNVQPSTDWQLNSVDLTVPAGEQKVAILHLLPAAGTLTTDDFSLTAAAPPVVVTPPTSGNLIANPSMETANGQAPAGWQTDNWGTNATSFSYVTSGGHTGSASAKVTTTSYSDGDAKWYFTPVTVQPGTSYTFSDYYQSTLASSLVARFASSSGAFTYVTLANPAASSSWTQAAATFTAPSTAASVTVFHLIAGVGSLQTDDASLTAATATNPTSPTVSISAPAANATVSGSTTVTAAASSPNPITKVVFQLDGVNLGTAVMAAPYQIAWDTTAVSNGTHALTAIMTSNRATTTSAAVSVTVNNQAAAGGNLILNPGLETANTANKKVPANWTSGSWGTNTAAFTYTTSASTAHSGSHAVKAQITAYTNGAAYWYNAPQPVTAGQTYDFKDYYKSNIPSEIDATLTMADGSSQDLYMGTAFASPNSWTKFETQFVMPAGVTKIMFYHDIYSVGYVTTDDYSLTQFSYQGFNRPIVTITDDDGFADYYNYGLPVLQKYGLPSTAYIISSYIGAADYMSAAQVKGLQAAGVEIGSHSVDHPDLSTLTAAKQDAELKNSQTTLQTLLGVPVTDYAAPYGAYNQQVVTDAAKYYQTYRGVQAGYNARNNFDAMNLQVQNIDDTTTTAQVQGWLTQAAATNTWLILVYHEVNPDSSTGLYNTLPSDFDSQMAAVKNSGLAVETMSQAMAELKPQLTK